MANKKQVILSKVFGDPQKKILKRIDKIIAQVNGLDTKYKKLSDKELAAQTDVLKKKFAKLSKQLEQDNQASATDKSKTKAVETTSKKDSALERKLVNKLSDEERAKYAKAGAATIDDFNALDAIRARRAAQKR